MGVQAERSSEHTVDQLGCEADGVEKCVPGTEGPYARGVAAEAVESASGVTVTLRAAGALQTGTTGLATT